MADIDLVRLNFNPQTLLAAERACSVSSCSACRWSSRRRISRAALTHAARAGHRPARATTWCSRRSTYLLVLLLQPRPSIALGMILVSSCPAGNISNFLTHFARGNTALSVSISTLSTLAAIVMTPVNIAFWGGLYGRRSRSCARSR